MIIQNLSPLGPSLVGLLAVAGLLFFSSLAPGAHLLTRVGTTGRLGLNGLVG